MKFTPGPYNANIGPGGPDMNAPVGFPRVQAYMKAKMSPFMAADQAGAVPQSGTLPVAMPAPFASNVEGSGQQQLVGGSDITGGRSGSFKR